MVSKSQIKLITSLGQKKYRQKNGLFVAEGIKVIRELLNSDFRLDKLFASETIFDISKDQFVLTEERDLKKISFLKTPQTALGLFKIPQQNLGVLEDLTVALDGVRDPGNLGTIIRLCDWFGVKNLVCSTDTVDCFNPKVIQSTMGSITRVNVVYKNLSEFLQSQDIVSYGTFMDGENVYQKRLQQKSVLVLGNEANGINPEIENLISEKISIPQFGKSQETESLNVATATAIFLSEFRRN
ncbi:MAG: RNA methyltransferase [Zunongwangia sp.]|nr:RNA methyltransferase [Zunongwangia profunda]MAC63740.1 RNA methyltransferase [Flavobacteriaceae bacterium]MAC66370.1 RNA methyltransferase [Flavobacteriaceae bacterium]MAO38451.1 RNA methyltransferase [Zunongwangia sp.]MAS69093.1 RNA methyltransferase [Zunongwangia sp.]|tara:strand:+ start:4850 stop:5572 length:723 start_codon:yes stop_codon:yes gene_type:complete